MIQVENLTKIYGDTTAVRGVSFGVAKGEILGFLGPNGAGKSTTMRILTGFMPPTDGRATIGGFDVTKESRQVRRLLGYLPESAPVYGEMTVRDYVGFFAEVKGIGGSSRRSAVDQALEECGLDKVGHRLLMNMSKGYRQRAGLAQAVVGDPQVLILDEPTVGLDPSQIREVRSLIRGMAGRRTVILSTHILPEVSLTCSQVAIINQGRIVASGTPESIQARANLANNLVLLIRGNRSSVKSLLEKVPQVSKVDCSDPLLHGSENASPEKQIHEFTVAVRKQYDLRAELSRAVIEGGFDLLEVRSMGLSLEDIFIQTVTGENVDEPLPEHQLTEAKE